MTARFLLVAPIASEHPIELGDVGISRLACGICLQRTPDWAFKAVAASPFFDRHLFAEETYHCLVVERESADDLSKGPQHLHRLATVGWVLGFALGSERHYMFEMDAAGPVLRSVQDADFLFLDPQCALDEAALLRLSAMFEVVLDLPRQTSVWRAVDLLGCALGHSREEVRYLLYWSALEALFGPDKGEAVAHKLGERLARFSQGSMDHMLSTYAKAKQSYDFRSKVVHGADLKRGAPEVDWLEQTLRTTLSQILESEPMRVKFCAKNRDELLNNDVIAGF